MPRRFDQRIAANRILDYLTNDRRPQKMRAIVKGCFPEGYVNKDYINYRGTIERLYLTGLLFKAGAAKPSYWIKDDVVAKGWNDEDPFNTRIPGVTTPGAEAGEHSEVDSHAVAELREKIEALEKEVKVLVSAKPRTIEIKIETEKEQRIVKLKNVVTPPQFEIILDLARCRQDILLIGPTQCGKSFLAELLAKSLDMEFDGINCTGGMSESHFIGKSVPDITHGKSKFQSAPFLTRYEEGGVFIVDEMDGLDPNVFLCLNSALANGYMYLPHRPEKPKALRHKDFIMIGTANTAGRGASRMYVGRNQLDESTLERFRIGTIEVNYDEGVEAFVCPDEEIRDRCLWIRKKIDEAGLRRVMSTGFMKRAYVMKTKGKWKIDKILDRYFVGWSEEEKNKVKWIEPMKFTMKREDKDVEPVVDHIESHYEEGEVAFPAGKGIGAK